MHACCAFSPPRGRTILASLAGGRLARAAGLAPKRPSKNKLGTVPIFVRRKWDCPLGASGSCCWTAAKPAGIWSAVIHHRFFGPRKRLRNDFRAKPAWRPSCEKRRESGNKLPHSKERPFVYGLADRGTRGWAYRGGCPPSIGKDPGTGLRSASLVDIIELTLVHRAGGESIAATSGECQRRPSWPDEGHTEQLIDARASCICFLENDQPGSLTVTLEQRKQCVDRAPQGASAMCCFAVPLGRGSRSGRVSGAPFCLRLSSAQSA